MHRLPPDRHVECLADDWVDLVPQRELHVLHDDTMVRAPSSRRFSFVASSPPSPPLVAPSTPDAWLALAEESMRPSRASASTTRAHRAARLVMACTTALHASGPANDGQASTAPKRAFPSETQGDDTKTSRDTPTPQTSPPPSRSRNKGPQSRNTKYESSESCVEGTILVTVVSACVLVACLLVASFLDDAETRPPSRVFAPYARRLLVSDIAPRAPSLGASSPASESAQVTVDAMERRTRDALATLEELRAELEAARETAATLSQEGRRCRRDVARVSAEASTWRRASEAWYAAYAEVVQEAGCLVNTKRNKR